MVLERTQGITLRDVDIFCACTNTIWEALKLVLPPSTPIVKAHLLKNKKYCYCAAGWRGQAFKMDTVEQEEAEHIDATGR